MRGSGSLPDDTIATLKRSEHDPNIYFNALRSVLAAIVAIATQCPAS